jgi:hypothetical protein
MDKVILPPTLAADFHGFQNPLAVCDSQGNDVGVFLPIGTYQKLLAKLEIPYSQEELDRRRQEKGGRSLQEFWRGLGQP